ncbi:O-methyltransferase [Phascolomyces articulosus]|uniref:O-methyltransferase n=1 Tax=Phascolomyces articulosus TaxID=60185 RepID=A0AAD5PHD3_9FUNG|nr:O-methyltransferase [Phascolomyces articulosus]
MASTTQLKLLHQLVKIFKPTRVLEIGTFTGGSSISIASALPVPTSSSPYKVVTLEIDPKALKIAKNYAKKAKVDDRIEFIPGSALQSLHLLATERPEEQYDFIFIDADKGSYTSYYNFIMDQNLLSDRGIIIADNVLFYGQVHRQAGYEEMDNSYKDIPHDIIDLAKLAHSFNQRVLQDDRVEVVMLPLFDGISIITKKR